MDRSLDVSYALLSDVSAQNRALQMRLHSSLPMLWTDNALVMKSAAPRRRRGGGLHSQAEQSATGEADQMLVALEGNASLQVSRRYKRRVEWEVARRIARVDRELQQYPPAQRFWNQKRKETALPYRQRKDRAGVLGGGQIGMVGTAVGEEIGVQPPLERLTRNGVTRVNQSEKRLWGKPEIAEERKVMKHVGTSPRPVAGEDKENAKQNVAPRAAFGAVGDTDSPFRGSANSTKLLPNEPHDDLDLDEDVKGGDKTVSPVGLAKPAGNAVLSSLDEAKPKDSRQNCSSPVKSVHQRETKTAASIRHDSGAEDMLMVKEISPRRVHTDDRPSSSIGRQVLSEFRTMSSVASFGARPVLSAGGLGNPGDMRLNADVLRRLFGDLDTDKDGHVNRIETCMALHRLQISVPTTKIISFFRHIHSSSDGNAVRSRTNQHLPMKEVINYKEFVAFVTAAYDQQQQQKAQRSRTAVQTKVKKESHSRIPVLSAPSTLLPIFSQPNSSSMVKRHAREPQPPMIDQEVRVYEVDTVRPEERIAAFEERVMKEIPEFLVNRIFTDIPHSVNVEARKAAVSVVRRSLESLAGKEAVDEQLVCKLTQELLRERIRNIGTFNQEDKEDVTGLRKAAAYYNGQTQYGDLETNSAAEDAISDDLVNWANILTEEQVSGLVQQIWKNRQMNLYQAPLETAGAMSIENLTEEPKDQTMKWVGEATDTTDISVVATESGAQVSGVEEESILALQSEVAVIPEEKHEDAAVSPPTDLTSSQPMRFSRTHFIRALGPSLRDSNDSHELFGTVTSIEVLQRLRQERRIHQSKLAEQYMKPFSDEAMKPSQEPRPSIHREQSNTSIDLLGSENLLSSEDECKSTISESENWEQGHKPEHEAGKRDRDILLPLPTTEPVPLTEKVLNVNDIASSENSLEIASRSVSVISSLFSSTSDYQHKSSIHREIDRHQLRARSFRRRRPQRQRRRLSVSGSSVPDSICSAELSEGELSREEALDLSDGEIFGECKRKYCNQKDTNSSMMGGNGSLLNSVESGELPTLMKAHSNFRRQVLAQSSSSVESGEVEDGAISD